MATDGGTTDRQNGQPNRARWRAALHGSIVLAAAMALFLWSSEVSAMPAISLERLNETSSGYGSNSSAVLFSPEWQTLFASEAVGCHLARKRYVWRPCGFGSNIIHLLNGWVYGLGVKGWSDVAVISKEGQLEALQCVGSEGETLKGYKCLFRPMPHVCNFDSIDAWKHYMATHGVPADVQKEAPQLEWQYIRKKQSGTMAKALEPLGLTPFEAIAIMARYMWDNMTPWLEEDVRKETERPALDVFRDSPFVGLHIRRGDKIAEHEMKKVETEEYLQAAFDYLEDPEGTGRTPANEIKAIWVASDDHTVVNEVRALAPKFFPNVALEHVTWISGGDNGSSVATRSELESYRGFVFVFADLQLLAQAHVFVGTFSSNVSRLVAVLREGIGGKQKDSCISLDKKIFGVNYRRRLLGH